MLNWLYKNWAKLSVLFAIVLTVFIVIFIKLENIVLFLIWIQIPIYLLHQFEEHAWNGFQNYINKKVFKVHEGNFPLNEKNIFWINIPIIWILMPIFAGLSSINIMFGLWIPYFAVFNSLSHVIFSIRNREYNPGLIISLILGIPVGTYTLIVFYSYIAVPAVISIISIFFVLLLHIIIFGYIRMNYKKNQLRPK
ncbi:HXXEE domain-containing protein [Methanobacterium sp.]|uniref:HXXEE domain-containing protein n=1 Tax=Methanobacterium sp. TaxID=2164 RepID=UPI0025F4E85C|nr:HXXEE domain-containing protein [Methanobacterium sp.]MBI5458213.1 HXXEE domain-containing protein [Methanobacterium sp.]